jgi:predicted GIY-YIG superfamily endonuclease
LAGQQMKKFFYVYILVSEANETIRYTGVTRDLEERLLTHNRGNMCTHIEATAMASRNGHCVQIRTKSARIRKIFKKRIRP